MATRTLFHRRSTTAGPGQRQKSNTAFDHATNHSRRCGLLHGRPIVRTEGRGDHAEAQQLGGRRSVQKSY